MIGKSLRSYRIEAQLGAGGMGVVYKAVDSRLGRTAAIKILSTAALNAERERRFVQEAKAASSLNHPNIVTIYDLDTQEVDGIPLQYIAMEYVAGETLDHLIGKKGLRIREVLNYAIQIADALAAAHAAQLSSGAVDGVRRHHHRPGLVEPRRGGHRPLPCPSRGQQTRSVSVQLFPHAHEPGHNAGDHRHPRWLPCAGGILRAHPGGDDRQSGRSCLHVPGVGRQSGSCASSAAVGLVIDLLRNGCAPRRFHAQ